MVQDREKVAEWSFTIDDSTCSPTSKQEAKEIEEMAKRALENLRNKKK